MESTMRHPRTYLFLLLFLWLLAGCSRQPGVEGVDGMASMAPESALAFAAADIRKSLEWEKVAANWEKIQDNPGMVARAKVMEAQSGVKAGDMFQGLYPAGWAAVLDAGGRGRAEDLAWVVAVMVRDQQHASACVSQLAAGGSATTAQVDGVSVSSYPRGFSSCFHEGFLWFSNSKEGLQTALKGKSAPLSSQEGFRQARQSVGGQTDVFVFVPIEPLVTFGSKAYRDAGGKLDDAQLKGLAGFKYLTGGLQAKEPYQPKALLAVDRGTSSPLMQALMMAPNNTHSPAEIVPKDWSFYLMAHLGYQMRAGKAALLMLPDGEDMVQAFSGSVSDLGATVQDLDGALTGEVALALDTAGYFKSIPEAPPNGMLILGVKDPKAFSKLLRSFCTANGLALKSGKDGETPVDRVEGVPGLLIAHRVKPYPHSALVFGAKPEEVLADSVAVAPGKSMRDAKPFKGVEKPSDVLSVNYDLRTTMKELAASGLLALTPELAQLKDAVENYEPAWWQGFMVARVDENGLVAEGSPITMSVAGVFGVAIGAAMLE